ncbi:MAG: prolipoprotein diacylglyceryl transferase [Gammaproteobacteria bacterium]|nr:prolipoprotein diacylglyceryl transferase [Gammaproteobacteria bacterium]
MQYPLIDPVLAQLGPFALRWYGLMYVLAFGVMYLLGRRRAGAGWSVQEVSDLVFYGVAGIVLGGRLGFVLFYGLDQFLRDPLWLLRIWEGGMSFHGGLLGALAAMAVFARRRAAQQDDGSQGTQTLPQHRSFLEVTDFVAPLVPLGIGLGRLGNFINAELPGRVTESALGVHFPCASVQGLSIACYGEFETATRHVSSLYQAVGEGLLLFAVVWWFSARARSLAASGAGSWWVTPGRVSGCFLVASGIIRFATEFFREPDAGIGYIVAGWLTMGQLLSLPTAALGTLLLLWTVPAKAGK